VPLATKFRHTTYQYDLPNNCINTRHSVLEAHVQDASSVRIVEDTSVQSQTFALDTVMRSSSLNRLHNQVALLRHTISLRNDKAHDHVVSGFALNAHNINVQVVTAAAFQVSRIAMVPLAECAVVCVDMQDGIDWAHENEADFVRYRTTHGFKGTDTVMGEGDASRNIRHASLAMHEARVMAILPMMTDDKRLRTASIKDVDQWTLVFNMMSLAVHMLEMRKIYMAGERTGKVFVVPMNAENEQSVNVLLLLLVLLSPTYYTGPNKGEAPLTGINDAIAVVNGLMHAVYRTMYSGRMQFDHRCVSFAALVDPVNVNMRSIEYRNYNTYKTLNIKGRPVESLNTECHCGFSATYISRESPFFPGITRHDNALRLLSAARWRRVSEPVPSLFPELDSACNSPVFDPLSGYNDGLFSSPLEPFFDAAVVPVEVVAPVEADMPPLERATPARPTLAHMVISPDTGIKIMTRMVPITQVSPSPVRGVPMIISPDAVVEIIKAKAKVKAKVEAIAFVLPPSAYAPSHDAIERRRVGRVIASNPYNKRTLIIIDDASVKTEVKVEVKTKTEVKTEVKAEVKNDESLESMFKRTLKMASSVPTEQLDAIRMLNSFATQIASMPGLRMI
jgi:hypothetical protein